ncbi:MAG: sugar transferase [Octadecabacter sp.]|nr:sugar transferase [Octadecabacter sp.]
MKRLFDLVVAAVVLALSMPITFVVCAAILLREGRPVFYVSERMKTPDQPFNLIKFRTMTNTAPQANTGVTGGDKAHRITPVGRVLRRFRLDEVPQLINVLRGDMSLVGPRPPLRQYTDAFPALYARVLKSKPGITGLATLHYHRQEERLIAASSSAEETETIYTTRCIPRKAMLDLIYARHASVCYDVLILWQSLLRVLRR